MSIPETVLDGTCSHRNCEGKPEYRMRAICRNCDEPVVIRLTFTHERPFSGGPQCPTCGCRDWTWKERIA